MAEPTVAGIAACRPRPLDDVDVDALDVELLDEEEAVERAGEALREPPPRGAAPRPAVRLNLTGRELEAALERGALEPPAAAPARARRGLLLGCSLRSAMTNDAVVTRLRRRENELAMVVVDLGDELANAVAVARQTRDTKDMRAQCARDGEEATTTTTTLRIEISRASKLLMLHSTAQ